MLDLDNPLAGHMAVHILAMNVAAPLAVVAAKSLLPERAQRSAYRRIGTASVLQLAVLWGWHTPPALQFALASPGGSLAMQLSLLAAALWFWLCVVSAAGESPWRAVLALLITGKLFCLLGALLTFAPRLLYPGLAGGHAPAASIPIEAALADQHLAGLLMLVACPLTYVLAGIVIAAHWILGRADDGHALARSTAWKR